MTMPVTRIEIADHIEHVFDGRPHTLEELLDAARSSRARPAVLDTLGGLPPSNYAHLRELWNHLTKTPVGDSVS